MMSYLEGEKARIFVFPHNEILSEPIKIDMQGLSLCDESFKIESKPRPISVLGYVNCGTGCIVTDQGKFTVSQGDAFILHKNDRHHYYTHKGSKWEFYWYNIGGDFFLEMLSSYYLYDSYVINNTALLSLFKDSFDYVISSNDTFEEKHIKQIAAIHEILIRLSHLKNGTAEKIHSKTLIVKNYIDNHIYNKLTLPALEEATGIPKHIITAAFKKDLKDSPYNYILTRKIDIAKSLLKNSFLSVKEISYMLSFTDQYYFSNVFKNKTGVSPSAFRNAENS